MLHVAPGRSVLGPVRLAGLGAAVGAHGPASATAPDNAVPTSLWVRIGLMIQAWYARGDVLTLDRVPFSEFSRSL